MYTVDEILQIIDAFFKEVLKVINRLRVLLGLKEDDEVVDEEESTTQA